jgi:hypothetical protein
MDGTSSARIMVAGLALGLCTAAVHGGAERAAALRRDGNQFSERLRAAEGSGRRVCAVDRLAESRLPRTTCRTEQEWRERQRFDMRKE